MRNIKKHYKAFTILELLVTLILVSVVVIISYKAISSANQIISLYQKNQTSIYTLKKFKSLLEYDLDNSFYVTHYSDDIYLININNDTITYQLSTPVIVIRKNMTDTFHLSVTDVGIAYVEKYTTIPLVKKIFLSFDKPIIIDSTLATKYYSSWDLLTIDKKL